MLHRYEFFREDLILEGIINETYIYYAPPLKKALNRIKDNEIASDLLSVLKIDIKADVTFVNIDKDGYLSFTTARNAGNNLSKIWKHVSPEGWFNRSLYDDDLDNIWNKHIDKDENDVYTKSRNSLRIGRFINKVFPGKYNDKQIEEFVNKFKAAIEVEGEKFEIVEGDDIAKWYHYTNYAEMKGTLGNSCMKEKSESIFKIYTKNPDVCRLLILKEDDKILGRALIWKLATFRSRAKESLKAEYFMDRQYYIKESDVEKFKKYAEEQGWAYKSYNNHHSFSTVKFNGEEFNAEMTVQLGKSGGNYDYGRYPYVDTFRRYDPTSGVLYNDDDEDSSYEGQYILADTGGGYSEIEGGVWSEWHDRRIPEDEAVWSDWADSHIYRDRAVEVTEGSRRSRGWYPDDCDDITYDEWIEEYISIDDAVYSDRYGHSLLAENAVEVIEDLDSDGDVLSADSNWYHKNDDNIIETSDLDSPCYDRLTDLYRDWRNYEYIHKDILTKNFKGEWIISLFRIEVYNIIPKDDSVDITGVEWLSEDDAAILGYDINPETEMITDQFRYHKDIEELLPTIHELCNKEISKIRDILDEKGQLRLKFDDDVDKQYINSLRSKLRKYDNRISDIDNKIYID